MRVLSTLVALSVALSACSSGEDHRPDGEWDLGDSLDAPCLLERTAHDVDQDGTDESVTRFVYDARGRLREEHWDCTSATGACYHSDSHVVHEYDGRGNLVRTMQTFENGARSAYKTFTYDERDNLLEVREGGTLFFFDDEVPLRRLRYDEHDRLVLEERFVRKQVEKGPGYHIKMTRRMEYDAASRTVEIREDEGGDGTDTILRRTLNEQGQALREEWLTPQGDLLSAIDYTYDSEGNLESATSADASGEVRLITTWHYEAGLLMEVSLFSPTSPEREPSPMVRYSYDERGNLIEERYFTNLSAGTLRHTYSCEG